MSWWEDPNRQNNSDKEAEYEHEVRVRPNPKGTRPRSKLRPEHANARPGTVIGTNRGRYVVMVDENTPDEREIVATRARELRDKSIVAGDIVDLVGDTSGSRGTLGRIVRIQPRTTLLRRSTDDADTVERVIVANADQLLIIASITDPEPRTRLIDRYLVAAYDTGLSPLLGITKTDLADPGPFLKNFTDLDIPIFLSGSGKIPLEELTAALIGHRTVLVGHSGVGKSTLVNALVPGADRAIGEVNLVTGRGKHTSSSTLSFRLSHRGRTGWIIDTPGVRSFGLGHVQPENIVNAFTDLAEIAEECPRGCTHLTDAPDCAIVQAAEHGELSLAQQGRLDSLQRLLTASA